MQFTLPLIPWQEKTAKLGLDIDYAEVHAYIASLVQYLSISSLTCEAMVS